jgi:hypothetical protein
MTTQRKRPVSIRSEILLESNAIRFWAFDHITDKPVEGLGFRVDVNRMSEKLNRYAILDGVKDSIRDAGAKSAGATIKEKFAAMQKRADYLTSGADSWAAERGQRESSDMAMLVKALCREDGTRDADKVRLVVQGWDKAKVTAMMRSDRLRGIVDQLRTEEAKGVDTDELFEELDGLDD